MSWSAFFAPSACEIANHCQIVPCHFCENSPPFIGLVVGALVILGIILLAFMPPVKSKKNEQPRP